MPSGAGFGFLKEIGKLPLINRFADPPLIKDYNDVITVGGGANTNFGEFRQRTMRPIDIFPVKFFVDITSLSSAIMKADCSTLPITVDFLKGLIEYNLKLAAIGLCDKGVAGLRVWVNNETSSTDAIQNNYKENKIAEQFNNIIDSASKMNEYSKSLGIISDPSQGTITSPISAALMDGRHLSLPKIWEKTDYTPNLDLTVKLISPYGNQKSFVKNVAKPLLYLTALTAPSTYDGVTYGMPSNMYVRAYGITFIPLAIADSFSFVRGGTNGRVNWTKQPLEIAVSMSFKPAMPGFAAFVAPTLFEGGGGLMDLLTNGISALVACAKANTGLGSIFSCGIDPLGTIKDLDEASTDGDLMKIIAANGTMKIPGVTSLGSLIQSLRPVDKDLRTIPPTLMNGYMQNMVPTEPVVPTINSNFAPQTFNSVTDILNEMGSNLATDQLYDIVQANNSENLMSTI